MSQNDFKQAKIQKLCSRPTHEVRAANWNGWFCSHFVRVFSCLFIYIYIQLFVLFIQKFVKLLIYLSIYLYLQLFNRYSYISLTLIYFASFAPVNSHLFLVYCYLFLSISDFHLFCVLPSYILCILTFKVSCYLFVWFILPAFFASLLSCLFIIFLFAFLISFFC